MRFVTGQYAPFMEAGAMLGYVFDGETDKARSGVDRYVKSKAKELKLKSPKRLMRSQILPNKPIDETRHDLGKRSFITLFSEQRQELGFIVSHGRENALHCPRSSLL
jgi:hypothetical protein